MEPKAASLAFVALFGMGCQASDPPSPTGSMGSARPQPQPDPVASSAPPPRAPAASPPAGLACLAKWYAGNPVRTDDVWGLELPDRTTLSWDDGRTKTPAERLDQPDLEDAFAQAYPRGPIAPVADDTWDPGRARVEPLFRAAYGATARDVSAELVDVKIAGHSVKFHRRAAPALGRVATRLEALLRMEPQLADFFRVLGGTFNARTIAGTERTSAHAWGIAIDIDTGKSDYWRDVGKPIVWRNRIPSSIVAAFEAEGFVWGGRWFHYDTMHFEWRPELFDAQCRARASEP